jgi:hypothetical protein
MEDSVDVVTEGSTLATWACSAALRLTWLARSTDDS